MNDKHTPGLLRADGTMLYSDTMPRRTWGKDGEFSGPYIVGQMHMYSSPDNGTCASNSRRIAACWNACIGMSTDLLENIVMIGDTIASRFELRDQIKRELTAENDTLRARIAELEAEAVPVQAIPGWQLVPTESTPEMVKAYLEANTAYWNKTDLIPTPLDKWRTGTPAAATAESYRAMLNAAPTPSSQSLVAESVTQGQVTWCGYVAGMIEQYLKDGGACANRETVISLIIQRRLKFLATTPSSPQAEPPQPTQDADSREAGLTLDEIDEILLALKDHDGSDFEPECPGCTAYKKLAAIQAKGGQA